MYFSSGLLVGGGLTRSAPNRSGNARRRRLSAEEVARLEAAHLTNIRQVTSGLARAGEGYFSPDGRSIIFQAVPTCAAVDLPSSPARRGRLPDLPGHARGRRSAQDGQHRQRALHLPVLPSGREIDPRLRRPSSAPSTDAEPPKGPAYSRTARYRWEFPESMDIFSADLDGKNRID